MGKKRSVIVIDRDVDNDKVNEILRKKKKQSLKVKLSKKTHEESSARTRGIENPLSNLNKANRSNANPTHSVMPVTLAHLDAVA